MPDESHYTAIGNFLECRSIQKIIEALPLAAQPAISSERLSIESLERIANSGFPIQNVQTVGDNNFEGVHCV
jgi:hypothetical protein